MRRLWNYIPPLMSDITGLEAVIDQLSGMGIVDDCTRYRPIGIGRVKASTSALSWPDINSETFDWDIDWDGTEEPIDQTERPLTKGIRLAASNIRTKDIIYGTSGKVRAAYDRHKESLKPDFLLLCHAPSSTMISSELDIECGYFENKVGIPTALVPIDGSKDYSYGISQTLLSMGKLLIKPAQKIEESINLIGCNPIEWTKKQLEDVQGFIGSMGLKLVSVWGMKESTENLRKASAASLNWVVNVSGMRLAKYMYSEYGIPYVVGAPFGIDHTNSIIGLIYDFFLKKETADIDDAGRVISRQSEGTGDRNQQTKGTLAEGLNSSKTAATGNASAEDSHSHALVICEQLLGEALRTILLKRGAKSVTVASFSEMEKSLMQPGDVHLLGEDELQKLVKDNDFSFIAGDPDYKAAAFYLGKWIDIPNGASFCPANTIDNVNMAGREFESWLNVEMARAGFKPKNVRFKLT